MCGRSNNSQLGRADHGRGPSVPCSLIPASGICASMLTSNQWADTTFDSGLSQPRARPEAPPTFRTDVRDRGAPANTCLRTCPVALVGDVLQPWGVLTTEKATAEEKMPARMDSTVGGQW